MRESFYIFFRANFLVSGEGAQYEFFKKFLMTPSVVTSSSLSIVDGLPRPRRLSFKSGEVRDKENSV